VSIGMAPVNAATGEYVCCCNSAATTTIYVATIIACSGCSGMTGDLAKHHAPMCSHTVMIQVVDRMPIRGV
jgi:hypothetical protein